MSGCYAPTAPTGAPCGDGDACPTGLQCIGGLCVAEAPEAGIPDGADAALHDDALIDASLLDATDAPSPGARWVAGPDLPEGRSLSCAVALDGYVFSIAGGASSVHQGTVYRSAIDGQDLEPWVEVAPLPLPTRWHGCAVHAASHSIFVVGGSTPQDEVTRDVVRGVVASTGAVTWTPQPDLPAPRRGASVAVVGDTLFVLGGEEADGFLLRRTVYAAPVVGSGNLGPFTTATPLPSEDYMMGAAVSGSRIYLTGGFNGATAVRSALANGVGVSSFTNTSVLPERRERHAAGVLAGWLYVTGGEPSFGGQNLVTTQRAPLGFDGSVGAWESQPDLPEPIAYVASAVTEEFLYVVGGSTDNGVTNSVYILIPEPR